MTRRSLRRALRALAASVTLVVAGTTTWIMVPPSARVLQTPAALGVTITDRDGVPLRDTRGPDGARWRWISLAEIDPIVTAAFMAAEDRSFLDHHGIAWSSLARAARDNLAAGRVVSGASTISMQLARLLHDLPRGWWGKVQQVAWALRLERHATKQQLLEQYLNRVPLGQGTVGIEAAAALYFGTSAARLGAGRAALLAGIARSPARDNPFSSPERAAARRDGVLAALVRAGYLQDDARALAASEPVNPGSARARRAAFRAPHFTTRVLASLDSSTARRDGARIRTTLDITLQESLERDVRKVVQSLAAQRVQHAAAVVLHNATGDVLAWVGSPDFDGDRGQVDMVTSRRQPGSALKPFLYALAFERGYGAHTVLDDIPRAWMTSTGPYRPRNYDRRFRGPVRARVALASSLNVPAVQLADELGATAFLALLHRAGFASLTRSADHYGLGLALGNGEVSLLELANAYRALANSGWFSPVRRLATDDSTAVAQPVVRADAAVLTLDILSDADARLAGFGEAPVFDFPFPVAVKTGTSRHFTDNWAVAVTGGFTVAVWVGNFDGTPMAAVSGITGAGPLLRRAVLSAAERYTAGLLPTPDAAGASRVRVCRTSGLAAVPACDAIDEWQLADAPAPALDDWHRHGAVILPPRFAEWERSQPRTPRALAGARDAAPADAPLQLLSPRDGDVYVLPSGPERSVATVPLRVAGAESERGVRWTINGAAHRGGRWLPEVGAHVVRVSTTSGVSREARITVRDASQ